MLMTITPSVQGRAIEQHCGIVNGEAILGANAVVGVDLDYEVLGQGNGMLMVSVSGAAVVVSW